MILGNSSAATVLPRPPLEALPRVTRRSFRPRVSGRQDTLFDHRYHASRSAHGLGEQREQAKACNCDKGYSLFVTYETELVRLL